MDAPKHLSVFQENKLPAMVYAIEAEEDFKPLMEIVNQRIAEGWEPIGGLADTLGGLCSQAMIKRNQ